MLGSVAGRLVSLGRGCGPPSHVGRFRERVPAPFTARTDDFSTSSGASDKMTDKYGPKKWLDYNNVVYPPQGPGEERRPAFVCHQKLNIKYSPKKMWYVACFVRGMSVDEAFKQLPLVGRKGATIVMDAIAEAQNLAVEKHNVEFKTNLWIAESFAGKGPIMKGVRRHARMQMGEITYRYCHYFVRLEEGPPPENYYYSWPKTGPTLLAQWLDEIRDRKIQESL